MKLPILTLTSLFAAGANGFAIRPATGASLSRAVRYMSAEPVDFVKSEIGANDVVVFSKTFCPFCKTTKSLLEDLKIDAKIIELDEVDNGAAIQDALKEISGQRTVPNVFVKGEHLGGNDDTQSAAREGTLQKMLGIQDTW